MYIYKICLVFVNNGVYEMKLTQHEFDSRDKAQAFMNTADQHGLGGVNLTILQVWQP